MADLSPILQIAKDIFLEKKKPMPTVLIARLACEKGSHLGLTFENFTKKLNAALAANVRRQNPSFQKVRNDSDTGFKRGWYKLKIQRAPRVNNPLPAIIPPESEGNFVGRAGEYAVMSELLFWGFNVSLMSVDKGIDVVASKNNKYFHIQVKTAQINTDGKFVFTLDKKSFANNSSSSTFYIFVMRTNKGNQFAVMPDSNIDILIRLGKIIGELKASITIAEDKALKRYYLNKKEDVTAFINNFSLIK
jgi:hypothetical protein